MNDKRKYELKDGQKKAIEIALTGRNLVLLGAGGTGKSTVIDEIKTQLEAQGKKVKITATTGMASKLVNGVTINSFLRTFNGVEKTPINYERKIEFLQQYDILIIDETSMLSAVLFSYVAECIHHVSHNIQLILVGDFKQLKPVNGDFAFKSSHWDEFSFYIHELTEVIRQEDAEMVEYLGRVGDCDSSSRWYFLNNSTKDCFEAPNLCAKRQVEVDVINRMKIAELPGKSYFFEARYDEPVDFKYAPVEEFLTVKNGMRVMTVYNDPNGRFQNGSTGTVVSIEPEKSIKIVFDSGNTVEVGYHRFNIEGQKEDGETVCIDQLPIIPAYAVTIHKAQGMSLDRANIYASKCWEHGQLYTALSRVKTIKGIHIVGGIWPKNYVMDPSVKEFYDKLHGKVS